MLKEWLQVVMSLALLGFVLALNVALLGRLAMWETRVTQAVAHIVFLAIIGLGWAAYRSDPAAFRELFFAM